jgi:hypothetical protein
VSFECCEQTRDALEQPIIDNPFILVGFDLVLAFKPLLVNLILLGPNEGFLVDIRVDFDV